MTANLKSALARFISQDDLEESEAYGLFSDLVAPSADPVLIGAVLATLEAKGASPEEVRGLARAMRALALKPEIPPGGPIADIVGTGGDGSMSLNLSTGAALLAAAAGVRIAKHGNRSASSRSGSADVLERLGLNLPLDPKQSGRCLADTGFTFYFAPHYHPALARLAPIRKALGVRTVFNMLGPLANPAAPGFALVGAWSRSAARLMAEAFAQMSIERIFVVAGDNGWDEPTPAAPFTLFDVRRGEVREERRTHRHFDLPSCRAEELAGGEPQENAARLRAILEGCEQSGGARSAIVMGAALLFEAMGLAATPREAAERAASAIDDGRAARLLKTLGAFSDEAST
jgi:anthranilate phosphoribosyltransferase